MGEEKEKKPAKSRKSMKQVVKLEKKLSAPPKSKRPRASASSKAIKKARKSSGKCRTKSFCSGGRQTSTAKAAKKKSMNPMHTIRRADGGMIEDVVPRYANGGTINSKIKVSKDGKKLKAKKVVETDKSYKEGSLKVTPRVKKSESYIDRVTYEDGYYTDTVSRHLKSKETKNKAKRYESRNAGSVSTVHKSKETKRKKVTKDYKIDHASPSLFNKYDKKKTVVKKYNNGGGISRYSKPTTDGKKPKAFIGAIIKAGVGLGTL